MPAAKQAPKRPFLWFLRAPRGRDPRLPGGTPGNKRYEDWTPPPPGPAGIVVDDDDTDKDEDEDAPGEGKSVLATSLQSPAPTPVRPARSFGGGPGMRFVSGPPEGEAEEGVRRAAFTAQAPEAASEHPPQEPPSVQRRLLVAGNQLHEHIRDLRDLQHAVDELPASQAQPQLQMVLLAIDQLQDLVKELEDAARELGTAEPVRELDPDRGVGSQLLDLGRSVRQQEPVPSGVAQVVDPDAGLAVQVLDFQANPQARQFYRLLGTGLAVAEEDIIDRAVATLPADEQASWVESWEQADKDKLEETLPLASHLMASANNNGWASEQLLELIRQLHHTKPSADLRSALGLALARWAPPDHPPLPRPAPSRRATERVRTEPLSGPRDDDEAGPDLRR